MPRIEEIRIAGLQYNTMQFGYDDLKLDYYSSVEARHVLHTLINGGGKGALLQTIFQVMKPGTSWGNDGENKFQHFFKNAKQNFIPYTFHVGIMYKLDGDNTGYLTTGIVMTAEKKTTSEEDGISQEIVPKFKLYMVKHNEKTSPFSLSNLVFKKEGKICGFNNFAEFLDDNSSAISSYSTEESFQKRLKDYGINRKVWSILRSINKEEGGVLAYFKSALTNTTLFQEKIIPTISDYLGGKSDLLEMFKTQASIAEKLPKIERNIKAYREFLNIIQPYQESVKVAVEIEKKLEEHMSYGWQIKHNLDALFKEEENNLLRIENEIVHVNELIAKNNFKIANVNYAENARLLKDLKQELKNAEVILKDLEQSESDVEILISKNDLQIILSDYYNVKEQIDSINKEISFLTEGSGYKTNEEKIKLLETEILAEWTRIVEEIIKAMGTYKGSQSSLKSQNIEAQGKLKLKRESHTSKKERLAVLNDKEDGYQAFKLDMEKKISLDVERLCDFHLKRLQEEMEKTNSQLELTIQKLSELSSDLAQLHERKGVSNARIKSLSEEVDSKEEEYKRQFNAEQALGKQIADSLLEQVEGGYTYAWLHDSKDRIESKIEENNLLINELQQRMWLEHLQDSLNRERYLIPNKELKDIIEVLQEKGIGAVLGTEYIQETSEEERIKILELNPLLRYGVVVDKQSWERIDHSWFKNKEIFSLIPFFIRSELLKQEYSFGFLKDKSEELAFNEEKYKDWKDSIRNNLERVERNKKIAENENKTLGNLLIELEILISKETSEEILKSLNGTKKVLQSEYSAYNNILENLDDFKEQKLTFEQQQKELEASFSKKNKIVEELQCFSEEVVIHHQRIGEIERLCKERNILEEEITKLEGLTNKLRERQISEDSRYKSHIKHMKELFEAVYEIDENLKFPVEKNVEEINDGFLYINDNAGLTFVAQVKQLDKLKEERSNFNTEFARLDERKIALRDRLKQLSDDLSKKDTAWDSLSKPTKDKQTLELDKKDLTEKLKESSQRVTDQKIERGKITTRIENAETNLEVAEKAVRKLGREPKMWEDVNLEQLANELQVNSNEYTKMKNDNEELQKLSEENKHLYNDAHIRIDGLLAETRIKGNVDTGILNQLKQNPEKVVREWVQKQRNISDKSGRHQESGKRILSQLNEDIKQSTWESSLKDKISRNVNEPKSNEVMYKSLLSMCEVARNEIERESNDAKQAEEARDLWCSRAYQKVHSIIEQLKKMESMMTIVNDAGVNFPLVKIKKDELPDYTKREEIEYRLKRYFTNCISEIQLKFDRIDDNNPEVIAFIKERLKDSKIVFAALNNSYPTFEVYDMNVDNAFMNDRPKPYYYKTWETINLGDEDVTSGSGGQKLSARMIVMMLLLSIEKSGNDSKQWMTIISDNPFGQAVSPHVLDPIFAIADKLYFQWIVVCPPELVKANVSKRFPVYYQLTLGDKQGRKKTVVATKTVSSSGRVYNR